MCLDELLVLVAQFVGSFIGTAEFISPLLVLDSHASVWIPLRLNRAFITLAAVDIVSHRVIWSQVLIEFKGLRGATKHIVKLAVTVETSNYLILARHVELLHDSVELLAQFDVFSVHSGNLRVFLSQEEFQILNFVLCLAALSLPFEIAAVSMLPILYQLEVKVIVFFDNALVLVLKRRHGLAVKSRLISNDSVFILEFLESFSGLENLIEETFDQGRRLNIYATKNTNIKANLFKLAIRHFELTKWLTVVERV